MACSKDVSGANAVGKPKNILHLKEAEQYFSSILGDVKLVPPEKVEECLVDIEKTELSDEEKISLAALNKYVGVAHLDEDNSVKALQFLERSIQCYGSFLCDLAPEETYDDLKEEAFIYLSLGHLRNFEQAHQVTQFILGLTHKKQTPSNAALRYLAHDELKSLVTEDLEKDVDQNTESFEETVLYRLVAACKSLLQHHILVIEELFDIECQRHGLGKDEHLMLAKMLIRRNVYEPEILFKCSDIIRKNCKIRGTNNSCSLANVHFANGTYYFKSELTDSTRKAVECFKTCFEIRRAKLGENHIKTIFAKFELGRVSFMQRSVRFDRLATPEDYRIIEEAFFSLKEYTERTGAEVRGIFIEYAEDLAGLLQASGVNERSVDVLRDAAELIGRAATSVCDLSSRCHRMWMRIGEIYVDFKKYELALHWFLKVPENIEGFGNHTWNDYFWIRSAFGSAYCYFKLGDFISARNFFGSCRAILYSAGALWDSLNCSLSQCEFLSFDEPNQVVAVFQAVKPNEVILEKLRPASWHFFDLISYLRAHFRIGFIYETVEKSLDKAKRYYLEVLKICSEDSTHQHPVFCDTHLGLARLYLKQKQIPECEKHAQKCLELSILLFGPDSGNVEPVVEIFRQLVDHRKHIRKASTVFSSYMETFSRTGLLSESEFIASFSHCFAERLYNCVNFGEGELKKCIDLLTSSFQVFAKLAGPKNKKRAYESQKKLGLCHLKLGEVKTAEWHLFTSAIALVQNKF